MALISRNVAFLNANYNTNNPIVIKWLNDYVHSRHCIWSRKMDGAIIRWQPSFNDETVERYYIYYDNTMQGKHKSGRIVLYFTNNTMEEIGLFKFKRYIRQVCKL